MENKIISLRKLILHLRRKLQLLPMQRIIRKLKYKGIKLNNLNLLDFFAGDGNMATIDLSNKVGNIELWEINQKFLPELKSKIPHAKINIVDSFKKINSTKSKFDIILVDSWPRISFGEAEHFNLFPKIFDILNDKGILIILVMNEINGNSVPENLLNIRKLFYDADDPKNITFNEMIDTYNKFALQKKFKINDWFYVDRWFLYFFTKLFREKRLCFLVMIVNKEK